MSVHCRHFRNLWILNLFTIIDCIDMASRVYFRFSSSTDFDFVSFEGEFITIGELTFLISKKTGVAKDRNTVIELFDSNTREQYVHTNRMVPKNSSVIAKRSPAVKAPPISVNVKKTPPPEAPSKNEPQEDEDDGLGPGVFAPEMNEEADKAAISELVNTLSRAWTSDLNMQTMWRRGRGGNVQRGRRGPIRAARTNLPPLGYICHRCNTPGHFIDECPTNGDPTFDFIRVRYPTGIPSSMLVKDEQGGLLMPNGDRARLKPNTEKFLKEMECVPTGDPAIKRLEAPPTDDLKPELSTSLSGNPLALFLPLVFCELPNARDEDIRKAFFNGVPLDPESFAQCCEEHERMRGAAYPRSGVVHRTTAWPRMPIPSAPRRPEDGQWRRPLELYGERSWSHREGLYSPSNLPRKPVYMDQRMHWPRMHPSFYDPGMAQVPPFPSMPDYGRESLSPFPPPPVENKPAMHSKVMRLSSPAEKGNDVPIENGSKEELLQTPNKDLPYGFERHVPRIVSEHSPGNRQNRTRSLERSLKRKTERHESSDRSSSAKKSKIHKRNKEKTHSKKKDRERSTNRRSHHKNSQSPESRKPSQTPQVSK